MSIIWGLITIFLLLVEFMTVKIIYIWYALSAIISLLISLKSDNFILQFSLFIILGSVIMFFLREKTIMFLKEKSIITDTDKLVGKECLVTKEIKKSGYGEVKVNKKKWTAYSDTHLKSGCKAIIENVEGVRLKVIKK